MAKVYQLKRPKTNVQIIQQSVLLKFKYFMRFLRAHGSDVYTEVRPCVCVCVCGGREGGKGETAAPANHHSLIGRFPGSKTARHGGQQRRPLVGRMGLFSCSSGGRLLGWEGARG